MCVWLYVNVNVHVHESCCTVWALNPTTLFAFDAPSCGLQAASLTDNPLLPAMLLLLKMKVDACWHVALHILFTYPASTVFAQSHSLRSLFSWNCLVPSGYCFRGAKKRKTMKLSRDLSNLVVFYSVASQECLNEGETPNLWYMHTYEQFFFLENIYSCLTHVSLQVLQVTSCHSARPELNL